MMVVLLTPLFGPVLGFAIGSLASPRWRRWLLLLGMLLPLGVYTVDLAGAEPSELSFLAGWLTGLPVVGPLIILAMLLTIGGYVGGVALARSVRR